MHMLHHISFGVCDIERAMTFYDAVLAPLGYVRVWEDLRPGEADQAVGYGIASEGDKSRSNCARLGHWRRCQDFISPLPRQTEKL